jgi:hypothetical protein
VIWAIKISHNRIYVQNPADILKFKIWNSRSGVTKGTSILILLPTFREITASLSSGSVQEADVGFNVMRRIAVKFKCLK